MSRRLSRRDFLVAGGAGLAASAVASCLPDVDGVWKTGCTEACSGDAPSVSFGDPKNLGRVVELETPDLLDGYKINGAAAAPRMKELLLAISGQTDLQSACRTVFPNYTPGQIIGIKVNVLNSWVPTHPELVRALVDLLKSGLGVGAEDILVWDRRLDELTNSKITAETMGATVEGTLEDSDKQGIGRGYELGTICIAGQKTRLSSILTRRVDHLINFAVMKNHKASGFTGVLKNNYGVINNPGCFHDEIAEGVTTQSRFERAIPEINALDEVASKTRLWLMDAVIGICKRDTSDREDCYPSRLLAGLDPVALDVRGKAIRDEMRGPTLGPSPETISAGWLKTAERLGLGSLTPKLQLLKA